MTHTTLYHGSQFIIEEPSLAKGNPRNDYGCGFYCTPDLKLAKEWACRRKTGGYANEYRLQTEGLSVLDLLDGSYTALHWIALLLDNRRFTLSGDYAAAMRDLVLDRFLIDTSPYDLIVGYRADDAYFSFAESFIEGTLSLRGLERALRLGNLGEQSVLVSERAFACLAFVQAVPVQSEIYYPRFIERDIGARHAYRTRVVRGKPATDDLFALDILRMGEGELDARVQRISR